MIKKSHLFLNLFFSLLLSNDSTICMEREHTQKDLNNLFGFAIAEWQNSGSENCNRNGGQSNWSYAEENNYIKNRTKSGKSCNFMNEYAEDLEFLKEKFGINTFRFSVSWEFIEPKEGEFNEEALDHYVNLCKKCAELDIIPMITLHHFVHPLWFEEKGAFEKDENIAYFVRFSQVVFDKLSLYCQLWCTINEPGVFILQGYLLKNFPPGKFLSYIQGLRTLRNMMKAHVEVYKALKSMPNGNTAQIGIVHQYLKFQPYHSWNPIEYIPGLLFNAVLNTFILNFLKTGIFSVPVISRTSDALYYNVTQTLEKGLDFFDFFGLNYYSRVLVKMQMTLLPKISPSHYPDETPTDMPYALYPKGLYDAIVDVSQFNKPIYITENGVADAKDVIRDEFFRTYLHQYMAAKNDGYDVRGFYYWTAFDNFEWDMSNTMKFGACYKNPETGERIMRNGSKYYADFIKAVLSGKYILKTQSSDNKSTSSKIQM